MTQIYANIYGFMAVLIISFFNTSCPRGEVIYVYISDSSWVVFSFDSFNAILLHRRRKQILPIWENIVINQGRE